MILTRREQASINNLVGILDDRLIGVLIQRRSGQGHQTSTGRLQNSKGGNQLHE